MKYEKNSIPATSQCKHWNMSLPKFGSCDKGYFMGKIVTPNVCGTCADYDGDSRGLGDTVHKIIKAVGLGRRKGCGGCQKRRSKLNDLRRNKK